MFWGEGTKERDGEAELRQGRVWESDLQPAFVKDFGDPAGRSSGNKISNKAVGMVRIKAQGSIGSTTCKSEEQDGGQIIALWIRLIGHHA